MKFTISAILVLFISGCASQHPVTIDIAPAAFRYVVVLGTLSARLDERVMVEYPWYPWETRNRDQDDFLGEMICYADCPCGFGHYSYRAIAADQFRGKYDYDDEAIEIIEARDLIGWQCALGQAVIDVPMLVKLREWDDVLYIEDIVTLHFEHGGKPFVLYEAQPMLDLPNTAEPRVLDRPYRNWGCGLPDYSTTREADAKEMRIDPESEDFQECYTQG